MTRQARLAGVYVVLAGAWFALRHLLPASPQLALAADAVFVLLGATGLYFALQRGGAAERRAEERLRLVTELYADWYWEIDENLRFTHAQGGGLQRFGLDPMGHLHGRTSREVGGFSLVDITTEEFARLRAERKPYREVRSRLTMPDGQVRYLAVTGEPRFSADGRFLGYRGITREITAQVEAEIALQESERRLRSMIETLPDLVFFITNLARDRWIYRSPNWAAMWNYHGPAPVVGRVAELLERIQPEDRPLFHGRAEAEARGEVVDIEYRCMIPERGLRWMHTRTIGVPDASGEILVYGVTEDVTERHQALERISASDALQRSVLDSMAEGLIIRDLEGRVTAANRAAERIMGQEPGSLIGVREMEPRNSTIHEDGSPYPQTEFPPMQVLRSGKSVLGAVMGSRRGDDSLIWIRVNSVPLADSSGALHGVISTFQDISVERAALTQLSELAATLERRVAERTDALTKTNRELEAFAHSVSHDLRAPLRTINGFARLLADREGAGLDSESRRLLSRIEAGAGRMGELIDDVIAYSSATRRDPSLDTLELDRIIESVVARLSHSYPTTRLEIEPLGTLYADARMVEAIVEALVGNALKFSAGTDKPLVRIWASRDEGETTVHVADNGTGFDMAYAGKLFNLFQRLHHDYEFPGTGVGLATVRNLVERQGGVVTAHGEPGKGATFSFRLRNAPPGSPPQTGGDAA